MSLYFADLGTPGLVDVGYVWKDASGADIGTRTTAGVSEIEDGVYGADITPATGAQAIYWSSVTDPEAVAFGETRVEADQLLAVELIEPPEVPVVLIPDPASDASLCVVYVYTEAIDNTKREGITIKFKLVSASTSGGAKSERVVEIAAEKSMTTDADGYAQITLQRTDELAPAGSTYLVNCIALGLEDVTLTTTTTTKNLADVIT